MIYPCRYCFLPHANLPRSGHDLPVRGNLHGADGDRQLYDGNDDWDVLQQFNQLATSTP